MYNNRIATILKEGGAGGRGGGGGGALKTIRQLRKT